jgi:G3E family GTPase
MNADMQNSHSGRPVQLHTTKPVRVVLANGFLGAGKTSSLLALARELLNRGLRVGFVTNDQATELADTALVRLFQYPVEEVVGGCLCCRFDDLARSMKELLQLEPDLLLCESVGSCTDLAATVIASSCPPDGSS